MLNDLTQDQRALAAYMSELSEAAICAGWIVNLEHSLWRAMTEAPFLFYRLDLTDTHVVKLRALSLRCRGWIYFDPEGEETFAPIEKWTNELYNRELALQPFAGA